MTPWAQEHPKLAAAFAKTMYRTAKWANAHQAESAVILADAAKIPLNPTDHRIPYAEKLVPSDLQKLIDICAQYGLLKASFPATQLILP